MCIIRSPPVAPLHPLFKDANSLYCSSAIHFPNVTCFPHDAPSRVNVHGYHGPPSIYAMLVFVHVQSTHLMKRYMIPQENSEITPPVGIRGPSISYQCDSHGMLIGLPSPNENVMSFNKCYKSCDHGYSL